MNYREAVRLMLEGDSVRRAEWPAGQFMTWPDGENGPIINFPDEVVKVSVIAQEHLGAVDWVRG